MYERYCTDHRSWQAVTKWKYWISSHGRTLCWLVICTRSLVPSEELWCVLRFYEHGLYT